ncbi:MAG: TonB-dependent receptor [Methyloglobulus sp.]|nr:TonB-dependent receptor [Methyloglobulus sp.]
MSFQTCALAAPDFFGIDTKVAKSSDPFGEIPSVYSASKYEQKVTKAPASISIVTADEIKKYGYRTFGQIISSLRGFYNTQDRNNGYIGARGFGLPSDFNSRLLLLIDGHRYNNNIFDAFDTTEGFPVDVDVIERVEVVRGPSSSLYGTSAVFGVINVITKRGRNQHGANIKYSYGTNDAHKTSFSYGDRFSNGLEAFVTGTFFDNQGFNKLFYKEFDNPATNNGLSVGNDSEQAKKLMAKASFGDFSLQALYVNRAKDIPTASFQGLFNSHLQTFTDQAAFVELKYDHTFENQLNVQSRLSYNNYRFTGDLPTPPIGLINKNLFYGEWWRMELEASKFIWKDHHITVGGQYQGNFHQNLVNSDEGVAKKNLNSNEDTYQWALFAQDDYSITDNLTLNAGLRFDYYSIFGSTVNPRVALIYNPWQNTTFKLLYGTAFRAPNQFELNYAIKDALVANTHLKPEKLDTLEFIVEHYFTRQLRTEFNVFQTHLDKNITSVGTQSGSQNQNNRDVESIGVETQIENTWNNGFQGRLSYSWQNTVDAHTHQILSNSPEHMIKLNLIAPLWQDKVFLGLETQFMSSRRDLHDKKDPKVQNYVISNLTLYTQNWVKGLELSASAYNLFDERYFDPASSDHVQSAIQQDGLTFRVRASYDF